MKILIFTLLSLTTLLLTSPVSAQTATPSPRSVPKREDIRMNIEEKKVERVVKLSAIRKERIMNFSNKMIVRLEATVERIQKLIDRIEARIVKIEETDEAIDLEAVKTSLDEAKSALALVKIEITSLKESLDDMPEAEDPKVLFEEIRAALGEIKNDLKEVHAMLVKLVGDIKGLRVGDTKNEE